MLIWEALTDVQKRALLDAGMGLPNRTTEQQTTLDKLVKQFSCNCPGCREVKP